jgi:membrane carboxypeptidase/penicillin-binding protein
MWISFMQYALKDVPQTQMEMPTGLVPVIMTSTTLEQPPSKDLAFTENADTVMNQLAPVVPDGEATEARATSDAIPISPMAPPTLPSTVPATVTPTPLKSIQPPAPVEERSFRARRG